MPRASDQQELEPVELGGPVVALLPLRRGGHPDAPEVAPGVEDGLRGLPALLQPAREADQKRQ
eukprot:14776676-Alexandrium_andersonii.AAC.1